MADLVQNTSQLLRAGYGVEDIALAIPDEVAQHEAQLPEGAASIV